MTAPSPYLRHAALLRPCVNGDAPHSFNDHLVAAFTGVPVDVFHVYKQGSVSGAFNYFAKKTPEEMDVLDRAFCDGARRAFLAPRVETLRTLHSFGHVTMFKPSLLEAAEALATIISADELEAECERVYVACDLVEPCEVVDGSKHVAMSTFWFVPKIDL